VFPAGRPARPVFGVAAATATARRRFRFPPIFSDAAGLQNRRQGLAALELSWAWSADGVQQRRGYAAACCARQQVRPHQNAQFAHPAQLWRRRNTVVSLAPSSPVSSAPGGLVNFMQIGHTGGIKPRQLRVLSACQLCYRAV
jgi:hypothetical protein